MSISNVTVVITCDECSCVHEEDLGNVGSYGVDMEIEAMNLALIGQGWRANRDEHFCPDCPEPPHDDQALCPCQDNDNPDTSENGRCEPCNHQMSDRCSDDCVHGCGGTGYLPLPGNQEEDRAPTP